MGENVGAKQENMFCKGGKENRKEGALEMGGEKKLK